LVNYDDGAYISHKTPKTHISLPLRSIYSINKVRACGSEEDKVTVLPIMDSYSNSELQQQIYGFKSMYMVGRRLN